jgi:hypothetical protein
MDALGPAITEWLKVWQSLDANYAPLSADAVSQLEEEEYQTPLPPAWKRLLLEGGPGIHIKFHWPRQTLLLRPSLAAEHQLETDDGSSIAAAGQTVIGYFDGIGDCIVIDNEGGDPTVYMHSHSSGENEPLGSLSQFIGQLTTHVQQGTGLRVTEFIEHIKLSGRYGYMGKHGGLHRIMYKNPEGKMMLGDLWEVDYKILRKSVPFEPY